MSWLRIVVCSLLPLIASPAYAVETLGEGSAAVTNGNSAAAKMRAVKAALADATYSIGMYLQSEQELDGLQLKTDRVRVKTRGRILNYQVIEDREKDGIVYVKVRAEVQPEAVSEPEHKKKSLRFGISLEEIPLGDDRYRLVLSRTVGPFFSNGADGEMLLELRQYAEEKRRAGGYDKVDIEHYMEYLRHGLLVRERVAEAEVIFNH